MRLFWGLWSWLRSWLIYFKSKTAAGPGTAPKTEDMFSGPFGRTKIRRPRGPDIGSPGRSPEVLLDHPSVQRIFRNASTFLFDQCGLELVPEQFWPILDWTGDPGEAFALFISMIGCDVEKIRSGDPAERDRAREIVELLVEAHDIFDRLSPEGRRALGEKLGSGDYATVRDAAIVARELRSALAIVERWITLPIMQSFRELIATIERMAGDPVRASRADTVLAAELLREFSVKQEQLDRLSADFDATVANLIDEWPHDEWVDAGRERRSFNDWTYAFNASLTELRSRAGLDGDVISRALDHMQGCIERLGNLLREARTFGGASAHDPGTPPPGASSAGPTLSDAIGFFGFTKAPDLRVLKVARNRMIKKLQQDRQARGDVNYNLEESKELLRIQVMYDLIKDNIV